MDAKKLKETALGGILNNPVFVLVLGMCPTIGMSTNVENALGLGLATAFVLIFSNIFISLLRKVIPDKVRLPSYIIIIATFVTLVKMFLEKFLPALNTSIGRFIPLIVVNCIILGRAEAFSYKNGVLASAVDGVCQGIGYTAVLMVMSIVREFLGAGTFGAGLLGAEAKGIRILPSQFPVGMLTLPVGGFLVLGVLIAAMQWALNRPKKKEESK